MKYLLLLLLSGIVFLSCNKETALPFSAIRAGSCETATVAGAGIEICLDSVMTDSRCPKGMQCVWAGTALARFSISINGESPQVHEMSVEYFPFQMYPPTIIQQGYKITFSTLSPYPGEKFYSYEALRAGMKVIKL